MSKYTDEDVELVARALAAAREDDVFAERFAGPHWDVSRVTYRDDARAVLDVLTSAHRLIPAQVLGVATSDGRFYELSDVNYIVPNVDPYYPSPQLRAEELTTPSTSEAGDAR